MEDSSWAPVSHLTPHWLKRLVDDYMDEVTESETAAFRMHLLGRAARHAVWNIAAVLGADIRGVPGQACRLVEKYLFIFIRDFATRRPNKEEWKEFKRSLAARTPVLIASCIQLSSKMSSSSIQVTPSAVRSCLLRRGTDVAVQEIIDAEFQVFSTVGFRVPIWTCVEAAELLAVHVGLPSSMLTEIGVVVDFTEYRLDKINNRVRSVANLNFNINANLRTLHLAAASVSATASFMGFRGPNPTKRMAKLTSAPNNYIKCIADIILADLLLEEPT